ncbi:MAG TPA: ABC transporter permease [Candidatus Limnocylindrales bacterium]|nr:ABC transporter permease [Candidatus Limnocylindrales bacterium]
MSAVTAPSSSSRMRNFSRAAGRYLWVYSLIMLLVLLLINRTRQDNLFEINAINGNLRVWLPAMMLAFGQTLVVIGGGVDLSVGGILSMCNAILATQITQDSTPEQFAGAVTVALAAGLAAGALNGIGVTYLRLQPIVTTYATSFIFSGIALAILPEPGGRLPREITSFFRTPIGDTLPVPALVIVLMLLVWFILTRTRFRQYLFASGSKAEAAYATGVPVSRMRFLTYVLSGLFAALGACALTFGNGTGNPRAGDMMTLTSVVAVVLGGTALSGGKGSIIGSLIGVAILGTISNVLSFGEIDRWVRPLLDALIIVVALAVPGLIILLRRLRQ